MPPHDADAGIAPLGGRRPAASSKMKNFITECFQRWRRQQSWGWLRHGGYIAALKTLHDFDFHYNERGQAKRLSPSPQQRPHRRLPLGIHRLFTRRGQLAGERVKQDAEMMPRPLAEPPKAADTIDRDGAARRAGRRMITYFARHYYLHAIRHRLVSISASDDVTPTK